MIVNYSKRWRIGDRILKEAGVEFLIKKWVGFPMKKLINGIINFRKNFLHEYRNRFSKLVAGQLPDALLITCCDSRVVPNILVSTNPGDLFVLRNIGNLVPPYQADYQHNTDTSVVAAIEFAVFTLKVSDIIICGHSECGAVSALLDKQFSSDNGALKTWLKYAEPAYKKFQQGLLIDSNLAPHNRLSRINVIQQLDHLQTYPCIAERLQAGTLRTHGWWFDLATANIYHHEPETENFILIDDKKAAKIFSMLFRKSSP